VVDERPEPLTPSSGKGSFREREFEAFFREEYPHLVRFLLVSGASSVEEARDVAQDAFVAAFRDWDKLEAPAAWIRRVAMRGLLRQHARSRKGTDLAVRSLGPGPDIEQSAEQAVLGQDEEEQVFRLLDDLPPIQRKVFALRVDGLSATEIAAHLGKEPATVRQHLYQARRRLKRILNSYRASERSGVVSEDEDAPR
jgi:RNA polymerase sigma factor (sigma-70 family)